MNDYGFYALVILCTLVIFMPIIMCYGTTVKDYILDFFGSDDDDDKHDDEREDENSPLDAA